MSKKVFVELNSFIKRDYSKIEESPCEECKRVQAEISERLGIAMESCEEECKNQNTYSLFSMEEHIEDYYTLKQTIDINQISSFSESPKGRLILEIADGQLSQIFDDKYNDFLEKVKEHIIIL